MTWKIFVAYLKGFSMLSSRAFNSFGTGPSQIQTEIPFFSQQKSSTPKNLLKDLFDRMGSSSTPIGTLSLTFGGCKMGCLFFTRKVLEPSRLPWQPSYMIHFDRCLIWISCAKFKEYQLVFPEILLNQYLRTT